MYELRTIPRGSNKWLTDANSIGTTSFVATSVSLVVAASDCVTALVSPLIYECSDTVEKSMIPGGRNDERLTNIGTHNCYSYAK